jgi:hypothetical protein
MAADTSTNGLDLIPEKASLWQESLLWSQSLSLRAGVGYKDNVALSPSNGRGSGFFTEGLDLLVFRLPVDGLEFSLSVTGDDTRYWWPVEGIDGEDAFLANAQLQKYFGRDWRAGLDLKYLYLDQVLEELVQTGGFQVVQAKGNTLGVSPFLRRNLGANCWAQIGFTAANEWWQAPLDQQTKIGAQAAIGYSYGTDSQITLAYGGQHVAHNQWLARDSYGVEIPGDLLEVWQQSLDLRWEHVWDPDKHWRSIAKLGFLYNQDNAGGYFDYYRYQGAEELRFSGGGWEVKASAGAGYYTFPVQTTASAPPPDFSPQPANPEPVSPNLRFLSLNLSLRAEHPIWKRLSAFGEYRFERVFSNASDIEYTANTVTGGLSWDF